MLISSSSALKTLPNARSPSFCLHHLSTLSYALPSPKHHHRHPADKCFPKSSPLIHCSRLADPRILWSHGSVNQGYVLVPGLRADLSPCPHRTPYKRLFPLVYWPKIDYLPGDLQEGMQNASSLACMQREFDGPKTGRCLPHSHPRPPKS